MKRYEFADGLLQFLNAIAWLYGALALIGGTVLMANDQAQFGIIAGVSGVVGAITLLAVGHVGRAVIDIAESTADSKQLLQEVVGQGEGLG